MNRTLNDRQRAFIAAYIADPKHEARAAARTAGYADPKTSASKLMQNDLVKAELNLWRDAILTDSVQIAKYDQNTLIGILENQLTGLLHVQEARKTEYASVPGGHSGMIVKRIRYFGSGEDVRTYEELAVDNTTNKEVRETVKQLAIMQGWYVEKRENRTGKIIEPISEIVIEPAPDPIDTTSRTLTEAEVVAKLMGPPE